MGFNLKGFAFSKRLENPQEFADKLGLGVLEKISEVYFENAISSNIGAKDLFFTNTGNGTLITVGEDVSIMGALTRKSVGFDTLIRFLINDTSMAFSFDYVVEGKLARSLTVYQGKTYDNEGNKLKIEETTDDIGEITCELIGTVLGKKFVHIENTEQSVCYKIK